MVQYFCGGIIMDNNLQKILDEIKKITFLDFPDLQIYSKQSYRALVSTAFNNMENSSYLYFDVDRLGILNETFGFDFGDKALANLMSVIKKALPDNAVFCRIAGDEFCIIFPNIPEEECKKISEEINKSIEKFSAFVSGLSITSAISSSKDSATTIEDLEHIAEHDCSIKKEIKHQQAANIDVTTDPLKLATFDDIDENGNNVWDKLNNSINNATDSHLQDLRFHKNHEFNGDVIKQEAFSIVSILSRYLEKGEELQIKTTNVEEDKQYYPTYFDVLDTKNASLIFKLLHSGSRQNILDSLPSEELMNLKNSLSQLLEYFIRDPLSGLFTKSYLKTFLADKICSSNTPYQAIYLSDNGIKESNTAYGHTYTDMRLCKTSKNIQKHFEEFFNFNKNAFSYSQEDCHFIDYGGGDYVILVPQNKGINNEEINDVLARINEDVNMQETNSSFFVSHTISNYLDTSAVKTFLKALGDLKDETNKNKIWHKMSSLSGVDNINSLKNTLFNCAKYYKENVKDPDNIIKKNAFLTNIFSSFVSHQALHNEKIKKDKEKSNDDGLVI